jgi:hypothetical protein
MLNVMDFWCCVGGGVVVLVGCGLGGAREGGRERGGGGREREREKNC